MKRIIKYLFLCLLALSNVALFAQNYNFSSYTVENGLGQNQVIGLAQDSKGYMWFGTNNGGVSVFDGNSFTTYTDKNGLPSNVVFAIAEDDSNNVFIATYGGLAVKNSQGIKSYTIENGLTSNNVYGVKNIDGRIWLATGKGICEFKGDTIVPMQIQSNDSTLKNAVCYYFYKDSKENIWVGTYTHGVYKINGNKAEHFGKEQGVLHNVVKSIIEDNKGNVWFCTARGFNLYTPEGKIIEKRVRENESLLSVFGSVKNPDGDIWFASGSGLYEYKNEQFYKYVTDNGLPIISLLSIDSDKEGNIWIGTNGKGVIKFQYKGKVFRNISSKQGLMSDLVHAIYQTSKGDFVFGTDLGLTKNYITADKGIGEEPVAKHKNFTYVNKESGIKMGLMKKAWDVVEDEDGSLWIGTGLPKKGLFRLKPNNEVEEFNVLDGGDYNMVYRVYQAEEDSSLLLGTKGGLVKFKNGKFEKFAGEDIQAQVWDIEKDKNSDLWVTTEKGVYYHTKDSVQYFGEKEGLTDGRIRNVVIDNDGNVWFGSSEGLFRYNGEKFSKFDESVGLTSSLIYSLLLDSKGELWVGTSKGIQRINVNKLNKTGEFELKTYGIEEGFIGLECNANAIYEDKAGNIWFGTVKGLTVYNPKYETFNKLEPQTHITNIRYEFEEYDWLKHSSSIDLNTGLPQELELPYNINHLTFDFIGISLSAPSKVRYRYMLHPLDDDWLPLTSKNEAIYSHIPPGSYSFRVKSMNNDGVWNENPTEFKFEILPPWYQTWWFYTICVVLVASGFYTFIVVRTKALKKQKEILETQVEERTKELRDEKEKVEAVNKEVLTKNEIIEEKNKEITDSINYAKGIQEAILPQDEKVAQKLPKSFILFRPKDIVSGDFYWMEEKDGVVFFSAADCTGHGVPGAFVSMVGANGLNRTVNGFALREPGEILDKLTELVEETFKARKDGMDLGLCAFNPKENTLKYAGANNPLWIVRKEGRNVLLNGEEKEPNITVDGVSLFEVKANKQPVGSFEDRKPFTTQFLNLEQGDKIYVFSDGYPDQFGGPKGKKFMSKSMKKMLLSLFDKDMTSQKEHLNTRIEDWMNEAGAEQVDDICVFGVEV